MGLLGDLFGGFGSAVGGLASGVGHLAEQVLKPVETAFKHPAETLATMAAVYFGMPYVADATTVAGTAEVAGSLTGPGALESYAAMDAGYGALGASEAGGFGSFLGADIMGAGTMFSDIGALSLLGDGGFGSFGIGEAATAAAGGGGSFYDQMLEYLKKGKSALGNPTGKQQAYLGSGAFGLMNSARAARMAKLPNPADIKGMPGYQAGLDAVQATMAQQGYTGGSNAAAAIGKYGADFYNQYVNQRLASSQAMMGAGSNELGSLALLAKGFGLF